MKNWVYTCKNFNKVRKLIEEGEETSQDCLLILKGIINCCNELSELDLKTWDWNNSFNELSSDVQEEMDIMDMEDYEECIDRADYCLGELYDLCDAACIWLGI